MKITACFAALCCLTFLSQNLPAQAIPLVEAVKKGYLSVSASGAGGHEGECLTVKFENKTRQKVNVRVPAGQIFEPGDSSLQNLMVAKEETFALEPGNHSTARLFGFCVEGRDGSPGEGSEFLLGEMAGGNLLLLADYISKNNLHQHPSAQFAVWSVSDEERLEGIGDPGLTKFVADLLGKPMPEYHIQYQQPAQDRLLPGQPANWREALALNGLFYYTLERDQKVNFGLYNESGELVHTLFKNRVQRRGYHKFRFEFEIKGLPKGTYFARMTSGTKLLKELAVEF